MSTNVKDYIELAVDYGAEHMGRTMACTTMEAMETTLRRRFRSKLSTPN
jgi:hypothetical protein